MTARHRRRSRIPFPAVVAALVAMLVGGAALSGRWRVTETERWPEAQRPRLRHGRNRARTIGSRLPRRAGDRDVTGASAEARDAPHPRQEQAHRMIEAGADVIFGHHSHRLRPMVTYHGRPIFFGLGNFVWPHLSEEGSTTAVAEVKVRPASRFHAALLPAYIVSDGHPVLR